VLLLGHTADHELNQPPRDYGLALTLPGFLGLAAALTVIVLAWRGSPAAGPAGLVVGVGTVTGFFAIHLLPRWSAFSDPYSAFEPNLLSWALVALPMAAAAWLALLGAREITAGRATRRPA
jgi:hypothetical protein